MHNGRPAEAIELLQPLATYPSSPEEAREPYALALLAVGRVEEAEPFAWGLFERNPSAQSCHPALRHRRSGGPVTAWIAPWVWPAVSRSFIRKAGRRNEFMQ